MSVKDRLEELGIELPEPVAPVANYVPFVRAGNLIAVSGQVSITPGGKKISGRVPDEVSLEHAVEAARMCGINIIAQLNAALDGDLERVKRVIRLGAFVRCADDFTDQPKVANGASDLMVEVFGDKGRHARAAVGVNALPLGVAVEVDAIVEVS